jgi:hypothetical protein
VGVVAAPQDAVLADQVQHGADGAFLGLGDEPAVAADVVAGLQLHRLGQHGAQDVVLLVQAVHQIGRVAAAGLDADHLQAREALEHAGR